MGNGYESAQEQRNWLERLGARIPGFKGYQDRELRFLVGTLQPTVDELRVGQKASLRFTLIAFMKSRHLASYVLGILSEVSTETSILTCPDGHEYAPSVGFKFCPVDGKPLSK